MPRIFDNIAMSLLPALQDTLRLSERADFCVGYFNLRGWKRLDSFIEAWRGGDGSCCRLLVGMQSLPHDELRTALSLARGDEGIDQQTALRLKKRMAEEFREQLTLGAPTNEDESGLRRLSGQIKAKKVMVKLFLRHPLHAKLYLLHRTDPNNPTVGFIGSSNLTLAGLSKQGELNVDVLDHDACYKLQQWFNDRWNDRWCLDISEELAQVIDNSWAREEIPIPYYIYLKIAYHLSQEARAGLSEFRIPRDFGNRLFVFQEAAVKIAAHHLNKRSGVLIGDVVGLGKTLMATALARIFEDDHGLSTLIICPKNLVKMWQSYVDQYNMRARVISISTVVRELPNVPARYRLVLIDESHNLRNREGKRYRAIQEYIRQSDSKSILLSATPYNKTYLDLSSQLRLFVPEDKDLGIRPERKLREVGETEFIRRHQCPVRSLAAFEKSEYADDWRDLMRLYLVRRTRSFIQDNYAELDSAMGRKFLTLADGTRSYFPTRQPKTVKFMIDEANPNDQYARLYATEVVNTINGLNLPRYGLGNYVSASPHEPPTPAEARQLQDLSRAGKRLMGFCRTNLFKRLESSGQAFLQSIERHILRNYIFLDAIENGQPLPIGTQGAELLDARIYDEDADAADVTANLFDDNGDDNNEVDVSVGARRAVPLRTEDDFKRRAAEVYAEYTTQYKRRFKWLRSTLFVKTLEKDLRSDASALLKVLQKCRDWDPSQDAKLNALLALLTKRHKNEKVIVFTQFADTVRYLEAQLKHITRLAGVTGSSLDPTAVAWRFSPESNDKRDHVAPQDELRVLIATDVLSEGQNLQDCSIVVNYDLPWAIIRLVQRAGRVDRIGQKAAEIQCYSFLPADGVERLINLRTKLHLMQERKNVGAKQASPFLTFYRHFLLRLFHEGLGQQPRSRLHELDALLGKVPYLNGGLFEVHELERNNPDIEIPDQAFERIFDFFDAYQWHLDERPLRADNEINPDVLGYIFEKYINQKQMGAYYTKEDITGYISENTVIPFLFDAAEKKCAIAFRPEGAMWGLLQENPDRYIYEAVRRGVIDPASNVIPEAILPDFVQKGMYDPKARMFDKHYNLEGAVLTDSEGNSLALPTETWREYVERRKRCLELRAKLAAGEVRSINDLITYNLDIRQFAQDVIENCEGPELLRAFWHTIEDLTVLDPTCGSGAFLFAALNILEPLYEACLDRMQSFVDDLDRLGGKHRPEKFADFRKILDRVQQHPNRRYFILKSIIINNLYGVDIMEEAIEICKLRLFLKLVAQVERVEDIEPLPDIDFNIRAGNTLVGFSSLEDVKTAITRDPSGQLKLMDTKSQATLKRIEEGAEIADRAFQKFHEMQTEHGMDAKEFASAKQELRRRLDALGEELDRYLAREYGVDVGANGYSPAFTKWCASHQPFHWFVEFYGIMKDGGFGVIIGNPPWKEYSAVRRVYTVRNYVTETCGNLHCICTERASRLRSSNGRMSFIVQLPLASSSRMSAARNLLRQRSGSLFVIPFDDRPGKLFEGLENCRSVIFASQGLGGVNSNGLATARYQRWATEVRGSLFAQLEYAKILGELIYPGQFPKYANAVEEALFRKVKAKGEQTVAAVLSRRETKHFIFYQEATRYWVKATVGLPYYAKNGVIGAPAHGRFLYFDREDAAHAVCALLNSSLFYVYFIAYGDCFHLSDTLASGFPVFPALLAAPALAELSMHLMTDLKVNAERKTIRTRDGDEISYAEFYCLKSKPIIDEIDRMLARHYGFTDEELDFIINYDIKYRMGREAGEDEGE